MGISERKERDKGEMRGKILSSALKLFVENGYSNVTIRKIAQAIEYSPGTIYLYFADKDDIFFELHNLGFAEFYKYQLSVQEIADPAERLNAHGRKYIQFALENREYYDIMFISNSPGKKIMEEHNWEQGVRTFEILKTNIQQCMDAGYFKGYTVDVVAMAMWSYVHGIASLVVRGRLSTMPEEVLNSMIDGCMTFLGSLTR